MSVPLRFCPRCHRRIEPPKWMKDALAAGRLVCEKGLNLEGANCKKGRVTIPTPAHDPPKEEPVSVGA